MTHADIVKVFTFNPLTEEQESDLRELHAASQSLASVIYKVVHPNQAQQIITQLAGLMGGARQSIELQPRSGESKLKLVTQ
jgi:hypothetical protein